MRILMLDNEFPPLGGGTGVVNYYLLKSFADYEDVWIDLVTASRTRRTYEEEQFADRIKIFKVPVHNQNIHHSTNHELIRYAWRGLQYSRRLIGIRQYDLSFSFAGVPAGAISCILRQLYHLPYIVSLQGPDVPGFEARYNYLYPVLRPFLRVVWRKAAVVTAISREHQRLAHKTLPSIRIPVIPNGVDMDAFFPSASHTEPVNVLCVGRLIERKGQHHLLRAFARLRQSNETSPMQLTLVGTGDAEDFLKQLAIQLDIANHVSFAGAVPRERMPELYRQADIFVLPSQSEGMSMALLEAMASGLPVIVTDTGGTEELVAQNESGFIVPWADVSGLSARLLQLATDTDLRHRMGAVGRARAMHFSWPSIAAAYLELCSKIIGKSV